MRISKQILDKYATTVIPINNQTVYHDKIKGKWGVKARWKSKSENFQYSKLGYMTQLGLWIPPEDWLVIEFEGTTEQNWQWIRQTSTKCDELDLDYCICHHGKGKSPYIWVCNVEGMESHDQRKMLGKVLVPETSILDYTNLGRTLVPVIENFHWKHKTVHKIIHGVNPLEQKNKFPKNLVPKLSPLSVTICSSPSKPIDPDPSTNRDKIKSILSSDFMIQRLLGGNTQGYESPSHGRMALYFALIGYGLNDSDIHWIMSHSNGLNYHEKPHLHEFELDKARKKCTHIRKVLA